MPDTVLPLGAFGLIFVALVGLYRQLRTMQRALDATQRVIWERCVCLGLK